jgi:hypothetical protein
MCHKIYLYVGLALMVVGSLLAGAASADLITIPNASFEINNGNDVTVGWKPCEYGYCKAWSPTVPDDFLAIPDGSWVAYFNTAGTWGLPTMSIYNPLTETLKPGTYTFTMALGTNVVCSDGYVPDYTLNIETAGGTVLATAGGLGTTLIPHGSLLDESVVLNVAADDPNLGAAITIRALATVAAGKTTEARLFVDNARLDFVAAPVQTPEPGSLALLSIALLGLLCYAWRKRK